VELKILVLGGTRFFGRRLVEMLLADGHDVTVASRGKTEDRFGNRVHRIIVDRTDAQSMILAFDGLRFDVVYDQIGFNPREAKYAVDAFGHRVGRYIFTSTQAVYEHKEGAQLEQDFDPITCEIDMDAPTYAYDVGKRQAEAYLYKHAPFDVVAVRVCMVISGDDDYTGRFDFHVAHVAREQSIGVLGQAYDMTYVTAWDVADFLRFLGVKSDFVGPVNAGNGDVMSAQALCNELGTILGKEPKFHMSENPKDDADFSPYSPLPRSLNVSNELARTIGYAFPPVIPQLPKMVQQVVERLRL
jgi:nucleoside-diphosphate-sugar epimerase